MNWNYVTKAQSTVGVVGGVILIVLLVLILSWAGTALGTYLICVLMGWTWTWNLATAVWIGLGMLSGAFNGIKVNTD